MLGRGMIGVVPCDIEHSVYEQMKLAERCGECAALRDGYTTECESGQPDFAHDYPIHSARLKAKGCLEAAKELKRKQQAIAAAAAETLKTQTQTRARTHEARVKRLEAKSTAAALRQIQGAVNASAPVVVEQQALHSGSSVGDILAHETLKEIFKTATATTRYKNKVLPKKIKSAIKGNTRLEQYEEILARTWYPESLEDYKY